jgi:hypothetical protein
MFPPVKNLLPEGKKGVAEVKHFSVDNDSPQDFRAPVSHGDYASLYVNGELVMSDTMMEKQSNRQFVREAKGDVLIAGLGIGMILLPTLNKAEVTSITVIEKEQDVIDLVSPHYQHDKLKVICADIFEWSPAKGQKFDTIYFDIWPNICIDNLDDMEKLHKRARSWRNKGCFLSSWMLDELRALKRRGAR